MVKRILRSIPLVVLVVLCTYVIVYAGAIGDVGQLESYPPIGQANWTAWITESKNILPGGMPNEVLTEDNTNSPQGEDNGYSFFGTGDTIPDWVLQIINLTNEGNGDNVQMNFGGLGNSSGKLWFHNFDWTQAVSVTFHGTIPLSTTQETCPILFDPMLDINGDMKGTVSGEQGVYHIYRSQNASGAGNDASNGRYYYLTTITLNQYGIGSFIDNTDQESWYIAIRADSDTGVPIGCHSEPGDLTAAVLSDFTSSFNPDTASVELSWETFSDSDILGFDIYRSYENSPVLVKINTETLLVYPPDGTEGNQYSYTDAGVEIGQTYTYWLDLIDLGGQTSRFGPVTQLAGFKVFVPIMQK